jgi:hypothetical protein
LGSPREGGSSPVATECSWWKDSSSSEEGVKTKEKEAWPSWWGPLQSEVKRWRKLPNLTSDGGFSGYGTCQEGARG